MKCLALLLTLCLSLPASANDLWSGPDGQPLPDTASRQAKRGFSGALVITADRDWAMKWANPAEGAPAIAGATEVRRGGQLAVLVFFANPRLDAARKADVRCDIRVLRPDGSVSADQKNLVCYQGPALGDEHHTYLSAPVVKFTAEPADLAGPWTVSVTLRDGGRRVTLPLEAKFTLVD
ncbi:MAG: hypothetical protein NT046_05550 [Arenimonas sp.]|nr:hypothetical protein [Arenimonas sp.]